MSHPHILDYARQRLHPAASWYRRISQWLMYGRSPFLLVIRVYIGWQSFVSGKGHLTHLAGTVAYFSNDLHIPMAHFSAVVSALAELVGGILLALGIFSRPVAAILVGNFFVAIFTVEYAAYHFSMSELLKTIWTDQSPILGDTAFPFFITALIVLLFGPGKLSIDRLIIHHAEPQFDR